MLVPERIRKHLSEQDVAELERILWRIRPLLSVAGPAAQRPAPYSLNAIRNVLLKELSTHGLDLSGEATEYGRAIDTILGLLPLDEDD